MRVPLSKERKDSGGKDHVIPGWEYWSKLTLVDYRDRGLCPTPNPEVVCSELLCVKSCVVGVKVSLNKLISNFYIFSFPIS